MKIKDFVLRDENRYMNKLVINTYKAHTHVIYDNYKQNI